MSVIALELDRTLASLDSQSAAALERLVRDALALASPRNARATGSATDAIGWPAGYFDETAGSFATEPLEAPADPPPAANPSW